jgi:hypothetical protein
MSSNKRLLFFLLAVKVLGMARKNSAAVALGRRGGKKKVPKGLSMMTPERRSEIARAGAEARWGDKKKDEKAGGEQGKT